MLKGTPDDRHLGCTRTAVSRLALEAVRGTRIFIIGDLTYRGPLGAEALAFAGDGAGPVLRLTDPIRPRFRMKTLQD
jgi:hypothetical protein